MRPLSPSDPRTVGEFQLRALLGSGGMGRVYLGHSPAGRSVAVKVVRPELAGDPEFSRRFAREVDAAKSVSGMYTAPVVAAGLNDDPPWLATAFVPGPSLADLVEAHGPLPGPAMWRLAAGLAEALAAVHACGLVHRDLKPANVLLALDGPHVIDFGISRALDGASLTQTGMVVGTPGYMAPEQAEGQPTGPSSDVFSLGALLAFAATGKAPFGQGSAAAVLYRLVSAEPDLEGVPPELREVIAGCMAKDPAKRPALATLSGMIAARGPGLSWSSSGSFWPSEVAGFIRASQQDLTEPGLEPEQAGLEQAEGRVPADPGSGAEAGAGTGPGAGARPGAGAGAFPSGTLLVGEAAAMAEAARAAMPARDGMTKVAGSAPVPGNASVPGSGAAPMNAPAAGGTPPPVNAAYAGSAGFPGAVPPGTPVPSGAAAPPGAAPPGNVAPPGNGTPPRAAVPPLDGRAGAATGYRPGAPGYGTPPPYGAPPGNAAQGNVAQGYANRTPGYGMPPGAPGNRVPPQGSRAGATPPPGPSRYSPPVPGYPPPPVPIPGQGPNTQYGRYSPYRPYVPQRPLAPMTAASWLMRLGAALSLVNLIVELSSIAQIKASVLATNPTLSPNVVKVIDNIASGATVIGGGFVIALWLWLAAAAARGRRWVRPFGTTLFGFYTIGQFSLFKAHGMAPIKGLDVAVWVVALVTVITMWSTRTRPR